MDYEHESRWNNADRESREAVSAAVTLPMLDENLWPAFDRYLLSRDLDVELATQNQWFPSGYDGIPRVIIPANKTGGVFWQARLMTDDEIEGKKRWDSAAAPREDAIIVVIPRHTLRLEGNPLRTVVVEGPMDALAIAEFGLLGIAMCGNRPTDATIHHILQTQAELESGKIWLFPDSDSYATCQDTQNKFTRFNASSFMVDLFPFKDFAEMPKLLRNDFIKDWLAHDK